MSLIIKDDKALRIIKQNQELKSNIIYCTYCRKEVTIPHKCDLIVYNTAQARCYSGEGYRPNGKRSLPRSKMYND